jgi:hypothetical protein
MKPEALNHQEGDMSHTGKVVAFIFFALGLTLVTYWGIAAGISSKRLKSAREAMANASGPLRQAYERRNESSPPTPASPEAAPQDAASPWALVDGASGQWNELETEEDGYDWQKHGPFMESQQELIAHIRAAAAQGAFSQEGPATPEDIDDLSHNLGKVRQAARMLRADALYHSAQGDIAVYAYDLTAILQIVEHLNDPVILSQMVRAAVTGLAFQTVNEGPHGAALDAAARQLILGAAAGAAQGQEDALAVAYAYECGWMVEQFDAIRAGETGGSVGDWLISSPFARPWVNLDEAALRDLAIDTTEALALPYHEGRPRLEAVESESVHLPFTRMISLTMGHMLPALTRTQESEARQEAMLDLMQLGLQIEAYEEEHGTYPGSLELLGGDATDPFTGEPYVYRPGGTEFLLYSPGADGDDGGEVAQRGGDIVWRGGKS